MDIKEYLRSGEVTAVTYNSKEVQKGTLFVCKGVHFKEAYLEEAVNRGAIAYVSEKEYEAGKDIKAFIVDDVRASMIEIAEGFYGPLYNKLHLTGITGTKGKSSTTFFMLGILDDYMKAIGGERTAVLSTINNYDGVIDEESHLTTPEIMELYKHMNNAVNHGIEYMTMEVSSQALKVGRVEGITFDVGCFLNISPDHISPKEHPDFEDYFASKRKIFAQCKTACVNMDCDFQDEIMESAKDAGSIVTFSQYDEAANVYGCNVQSIDGRIHFDVVISGLEELGIPAQKEHIELAAFGKINVENALAAIAISVVYKVPFEYIRSGLGRVVIPGRMELFRSKDGKAICLVDYAHNQLSFEKLLETVREEFPGYELTALYGCAGGKALTRREVLGTISGRNCVKTYISEDDPGDEDIYKISEEIGHYVKMAGGEYEIIPDRPTAIRKAIAEADNTVILLLARGRETLQRREGAVLHKTLSDVEVVIETLGL